MVGGVSRFLNPPYLGIQSDISAYNNKLEEDLKYHELKKHVWEITSFWPYPWQQVMPYRKKMWKHNFVKSHQFFTQKLTCSIDHVYIVVKISDLY